jgi:hypothetical protein
LGLIRRFIADLLDGKVAHVAYNIRDGTVCGKRNGGGRE